MNIFKKKESQNHHLDLIKILIMFFIPYTVMGISQNGILGLLPFVREEFVLTRLQIGYYATSFFVSSAMLAILAGSIVDRLGPEKSVLLGIGCTSSILMFYGWSPSYEALLLMAIFAGLFLSLITPSVIKGTTIASPPEKRAFSLGIVQSGYSFGSVVGASLLPLLGKSFGWRTAVQFTAVFTLLIGVLLYKFYQKQNNHNNLFEISPKRGERENLFKKNLLTILENKPLMRICILGIIFGVSEGAVISHFAVFLSEDLNMSRVIAGLGLGILYVGGMIGLAGWGWVSDKLFRENRTLNLFLLGSAIGSMYVIFSLLLNVPQVDILIIFIFSFLLGFVAIGWSGAYFVVVGELAGEKQTGFATGLSLFFIRTGILIAPIAFGFIADVNGNYGYSWFLFGILIIVISSLFLLKEQKTVQPV